MSNPYKELDRQLRRERFKYVSAVAITLFIAGLLIAFSLDQKSSLVGEQRAMVIGVHQSQREAPQPSLLLVQFENGRQMPLNGSERVPVHSNHWVIVEEKETALLGRRIFKFKRYEEEHSEEGY